MDDTEKAAFLPLGAPPAALSPEQGEAWRMFVAELPWLVEADRSTLERAVTFRARLIAREAIEPDAYATYVALLSRLAASPADRRGGVSRAARSKRSQNNERLAERREGPNVDAAMAAFERTVADTANFTTATLVLIEAAQATAISAQAAGEMTGDDARTLFDSLELARTAIGLRSGALDLFPTAGSA